MSGRPRRRSFERLAVVVCDSLGCGLAPDADEFGDGGANTLGRIIEEASPRLPHLAELGLDRIPGVPHLERPSPDREKLAEYRSATGRLVERSVAKDTMSGHWELMCVVTTSPFPVFPKGFPAEVVTSLEDAFGRATIGNRPASGTAIIDELGARHVESGDPIIYTSADSVLQIAAHEEVISVDALYDLCRIARGLLSGPHQVARVIARPFVGDTESGFRRTPRRRDFALPPPTPTALDLLLEAGIRTFGVGKIHDIFSGRGLSNYVKTDSNADGIEQTIKALQDDSADFVFTNLVDFDTDFGHRRDIGGYAGALEAFDAALPELLGALGRRDALMITADHGNDPGFAGTDHTRECVPLLVISRAGREGDLGTRDTFADVGRTVLDNFGVPSEALGTSYLPQICSE